jgi:hypothetical protein
MKYRRQRGTARDVGQHGLTMAMHHAVGGGKLVEHLAVDEAFGVALHFGFMYGINFDK